VHERICGLFHGKPLGSDGVACFRKTGRLSADGLTMTWSDGVVWKRHGPAPKGAVRGDANRSHCGAAIGLRANF
jgi:hypothetical protein